MKIVKDQLQREVKVPNFPKRIISLVPSQTEFLHDLGLENEVIGITKFCIHPQKWFESKVRIGGTKNIDIEKIKLLKPDLIIANKEENTKNDIEKLEMIAPVWISDIYNIDDALNMMLQLGDICAKSKKSKLIVDQINKDLLQKNKTLDIQKTAIYLIWKEPLMAAGNSTFIHSMLEIFGIKNYYENEERYPLCEDKPEVDYVLLSSEPFPFNKNHEKQIQDKFPNAKIIFVDGEMFSWYGSRLLLVPNYFNELKNQFSPIKVK
jgi:ABC-type Fe3+-hydroxamate transport system substrate-binding protein